MASKVPSEAILNPLIVVGAAVLNADLRQRSLAVR